MSFDRHQRNKTFTIVIIPNANQKVKQFTVKPDTVKLLAGFALVVFAGLIGLAGYGAVTMKTSSRLKSAYKEQKTIIEEEKDKLVSEQETLKEQNTALIQENKSLNEQLHSLKEETVKKAEEEEKEEENYLEKASIPDQYPVKGIGTWGELFDEDTKGVTILVNSDIPIITAGDGTVTSVESDDTYEKVVKVDHGNGYVTVYSSKTDAKVEVMEGDPVKKGNEIMIMTAEAGELKYQIIYNGTYIDPMTMIEAVG